MIAGSVGRRFTVRGLLLVLVAAIVGLMLPAGAMALDHEITTAGVAKTHGYKLSLKIDQSCGTGCDALAPAVTAVLKKKRGHATQTASYAFFFRGIRFKNRNLSSATVKGTFANRRGSTFDASINMTFHATGPVIHSKSCKGVPGRRGVLKGTYTLRAGKFFGKITQKSFPATLWNGNAACGRGHRRVALVTQGALLTSEPYVAVSKSTTGRVSETIGVAKGELGGHPGRWGVAYSYTVTGEPGRDYKVGSKLRSATVTGAGGISGTATYSAKKANARQSTGTLSGTLAVTIAPIGRVRPFAKGPQGAVQDLYGAV